MTKENLIKPVEFELTDGGLDVCFSSDVSQIMDKWAEKQSVDFSGWLADWSNRNNASYMTNGVRRWFVCKNGDFYFDQLYRMWFLNHQK